MIIREAAPWGMDCLWGFVSMDFDLPDMLGFISDTGDFIPVSTC